MLLTGDRRSAIRLLVSGGARRDADGPPRTPSSGWLCERGAWSHDEFVEAIPYDETRGYTKRVLATYFVYAWMNDETVPTLALAIPKNAINKRACR